MAFIFQKPDPLDTGAEAAAGFVAGRNQKKLADADQKRLNAQLALQSSAKRFSENMQTQQFNREGQERTEDVAFRNQQAQLDNFYRKADELRAEHQDTREGKQFQLEQQLRAGQITEQQLNNQLTKVDLHYATALKALQLQAQQAGIRLSDAEVGLTGAETEHTQAETARTREETSLEQQGLSGRGKADYGQLVMQLSPAGQQFLEKMNTAQTDPTTALLHASLYPGLNASDKKILPQILSSAEYTKFQKPAKPAVDPNNALQWAAIKSNFRVQTLPLVQVEKLREGVLRYGIQGAASALQQAANDPSASSEDRSDAQILLKVLQVQR